MSGSSQWKTGAAVAAVALALGCWAWKRQRRDANTTQQAVVGELWVFPVKGCRGIQLPEAKLDKFGVEHDREWYVIKASDETIVKQGNIPRLALIGVELTDKEVRLSADGFGSIAVSLDRGGAVVDFEIWEMSGGCIDQGDEAAEWISKVTGHSLRLRRIVRPRDPRKNPDMPITPSQEAPMLGQDESPLMVMGDGTVEQIRNACGDDTVDVCRFRPNILLHGVPARAEDSYRTFKIGAIDILVGRLCTRCSVPAVRPDGTFHPRFEPTRTLKREFSVSTAPGTAPRPVAGLSAFHLNQGTIRVGDMVTVTSFVEEPHNYVAAA